MAITMATTILVGFISSLLLLIWRNALLRPSLRVPPGPRPLPILGNLLQMRKQASFADFANELKRKYGPIVTLWMGSRPVVYLSGPDVMQEALIAQGSVFMGRPQLPSAKILMHGFRSLIFGQGERHRFLRKMLVSEILSSKRVAGFRPIRAKEIEILVENLKTQLRNNNNDPTVPNFRSMIRLTVSNLLAGILFGRRLTADEQVELDAVIYARFRLAASKPRDFMPWLAWLPDREAVKRQWAVRRKASQVLDPTVEERRQALKLGQVDEPTYVDTLLGLLDGKNPSPVAILDTDVVLLCIEILTAGTDTTALNLEYCVANLVNSPQTQEKLAREIWAVVGDRTVSEDDVPNLPYLQAVVKEALRRHSPVRVGAPRRTLAATKIAGYDIPKDTVVMQHLEGVSLSPEIWEDPLEFRPERHLGKHLDITGSTGITMTPFGLGRRICPAINIALLHAQLILAQLIQAFEWKTATPGQLVDLTSGNGITNPMKYPLVASIQERSKVC